MSFRASFCDPFQPEALELTGLATAAEALNFFHQIPWLALLDQMRVASSGAIFHSPSFEVENKTTRHGITISVVDAPGSHEFYIFYKRPQKIKKFFGLLTTTNENYLSDIQGQTALEAEHCLMALINNDVDYLTAKLP